MPSYFIACYPRPADGKYRFDLDYYLKTHMPMQMEHHRPYGMRSYHVLKCTEESPYVIQTIEYWDNLEKMTEALDNAMEYPLKVLWDDIAMYTDIKDAFAIKGEIQGCWADDGLTRDLWLAKGNKH